MKVKEVEDPGFTIEGLFRDRGYSEDEIKAITARRIAMLDAMVDEEE